MGKATRWLRGLLGMKKDKENVICCSNYGEKKNWSFPMSGKDGDRIPANEAAWERSHISETEKEQNKHAIAVAATTAAAADAAVAAAEAAISFERLISRRGGASCCGGRERRAAVMIQTCFRGYLAKKALRALKVVVKLQAVVRGYLVRKRASTTLHLMQVLVKAQASVLSQRAHLSIMNGYKFQEMRARKFIEKIDESRYEFHSKRLSASYDHPQFYPSDKSPKIVEIDNFKPRSKSRKIKSNNAFISDYGDDPQPQFNSSPPPPFPDRRHVQDLLDWSFLNEEWKYPTANSTPRFANSGRFNAQVTPAKSVAGDGIFRPYSDCPSYMANRLSFRAKVRSQSAPKQRPETGAKRRLSLNEVMAARSSFSGVGMQRSCSHVKQDLGF